LASSPGGESGTRYLKIDPPQSSDVSLGGLAGEKSVTAAAVMKLARQYPKDASIVVNMSGRGDKDLFILAREMDPANWAAFLRAEAAEEAESIEALR
jgi:hypothetical protein